jgi:hypothetical protein
MIHLDFDMYHIFPHTQSRSFYYAPFTTVSFYWYPTNIDEFNSTFQTLTAALEVAPGCRGVVAGEAMNLPKHKTKSKMLPKGRGLVVLAGWDN